ncbi:MAG: DUF4126 domain-containing protein [Leucobacter sp.]
MLEIITGGVLATAAGLNAYVPLLGIALLSRFTELIQLPEAWLWLENGWVMSVVGLLLAIEVLVDKFPVLDTFNDVLQTLIRPASGGLVFSAGSASHTVAVTDPAAFVTSAQVWPFLIGVGVALVPHVLKALARPILNVLSAGASAAVMSTLEDAGAVVLTVLAVLAPVLAVMLAVVTVVLLSRRLRRARAARRTAEHDSTITTG